MSRVPRWRALGLVATLGLGLALGLAGCGKRGAPEAPGPSGQVTYPRSYPSE